MTYSAAQRDCSIAEQLSHVLPQLLTRPLTHSQVLVKHKLVEESLADKVRAFIADNQVGTEPAAAASPAPQPKRCSS